MNKSEKFRLDIIGKDFETNSSGKCFVIDYKGKYDVTVMFYEPLYVKKCRLSALVQGRVNNPYFPKIYGKGYFGIGRYTKGSGKIYDKWKGMLRRCYCADSHKTNSSYVDVVVCEDWHNFQNFADWFDKQTFSESVDENGKPFQLDKDILFKGNKIYSPETCCLVPQEINNLLTSSKKVRGVYPLGVRYDGKNKQYIAGTKGAVGYLGLYKTAEAAFQAYKNAKESYIKEVAAKWKGRIDEKVYKALVSWEVEVSD